MSAANLIKPKVSNIKVVNNMADYSKEPTSIKRAAQAHKFLEKHPLPKSFTKHKNVKLSLLITKTSSEEENG